MFYYFMAYRKTKQWNRETVISVPSGNFGNICSGMMAAAMGLPIQHFVASTNVNDTVPRFMTNGNDPSRTTPRPRFLTRWTWRTRSNFVRILQLFSQNERALKASLSAYCFTDEETVAAA